MEDKTMKKFFPFIIWLIISSLITLTAYTLVFLWKPSITCASFIAGGTCFLAFIFLLRFLQENATDIPFLINMLICLLISLISTLTEISFPRIIFSVFLLFCLIILITCFACSFDTAQENCFKKGKYDVVLKIISIVQAGIAGGAIYFISIIFS